MRIPAVPLLLAAAASAALASAVPAPEDDALPDSPSLRQDLLYRRDEHGHDHAMAMGSGGEHDHPHHGVSKLELNETELLLYHQPTPPSYWSIDFEDRQPGDERYPGLIGVHVLFMSLAFFGALPAGTSLPLSAPARCGSQDSPRQASRYAP